MSEIKLCKDCKHFSPPVNPYYSQLAAIQGAGYGACVNPYPALQGQIGAYPISEPKRVGLCKRGDLWTTDPVYGCSVAINEQATEAKWQRESGECGKEAKFFEDKPEPEPIIHETPLNLFGGPCGTITIPNDVPRPWWKFWGKA